VNRTKLYQAVAVLAGVPWREVWRYANGYRLREYPANADKITAAAWGALNNGTLAELCHGRNRSNVGEQPRREAT